EEEPHLDVIEAIKNRRSIRAFKSDSVPKGLLEKVIQDSLHSPSHSNIQPWHLVVVGGKAMESLKQALVEKTRSGDRGASDVILPEPAGVLRERRRALMKQIYGSLGISREDEDKRALWWQNMDRFFGAPSAVIVSLERAMLPRGLVDVGLIAQTLMLSAHGYGLSTCTVAHVVHHPAVLRRLLNIPDSEVIICGIAIGYPDLNAPVNQFRSAREPIQNVVSWHGLD
ncbi:MAG: nitroreductase, partial [Dehalococcoidia bacterium]|nr:nitroreductase [Dehalococcoidia bacterium]